MLLGGAGSLCTLTLLRASKGQGASACRYKVTQSCCRRRLLLCLLWCCGAVVLLQSVCACVSCAPRELKARCSLLHAAQSQEGSRSGARSCRAACPPQTETPR